MLNVNVGFRASEDIILVSVTHVVEYARMVDVDVGLTTSVRRHDDCNQAAAFIVVDGRSFSHQIHHQGIPRRSAMYSHLPQKALGIHVFPRIPTYSHVFPLVFPRPIYRLEKTFIFQFSKLYIPGIPTGNTVCCRRLCWADGIPMGIRGNTVCCRPSGNALSFSLHFLPKRYTSKKKSLQEKRRSWVTPPPSPPCQTPRPWPSKAPSTCRVLQQSPASLAWSHPVNSAAWR